MNVGDKSLSNTELNKANNAKCITQVTKLY